jgi:hypothetical protein
VAVQLAPVSPERMLLVVGGVASPLLSLVSAPLGWCAWLAPSVSTRLLVWSIVRLRLRVSTGGWPS